MHLARHHKVYLPFLYVELFEIDDVQTCTLGEQHHVVKCMSVRSKEVWVCLQVWREGGGIYFFGYIRAVIEGPQIVNRQYILLFAHYRKVTSLHVYAVVLFK